MLTARSERITRARRRVAGAVQRRLPRITRRVVGASVLLYHRVASSPADPWQLAVTPDHFDEHLQVLRANGDVVDAAPTAQRFRRHSLGRRRFAVTFDDGYVDNLQAALPLLERHDVPVTIFVATAYLDQPSFWWDRFDVLVLGDATSVEAGAEAAVAAGLLDTQRFGEVVAAGREALHATLYVTLVALAADRITDALDVMSAHLGLGDVTPEGRPLTTAELITLAAHPLVTIGGHTSRHIRLAHVSTDDARREIDEGARHLAAVLGSPPLLFAYPFGDANASAAVAARRSGFSRAFTTEGRALSVIDDPMLLPRLVVPDTDGTEFGRWVVGATGGVGAGWSAVAR